MDAYQKLYTQKLNDKHRNTHASKPFNGDIFTEQ